MAALLGVLLGLLPRVGVAILARLVSEEFLQRVITHVIIFGLEKLAALSTNTIDDKIVADIKDRLTIPEHQSGE